MIGIGDAIISLTGGAIFSVSGNDIIWLDENKTQPTDEEIQKEIARLEYQEEVNEYQRKRAEEYPAYADQFDQIFHDGLDAWTATIQAVKDKYPKETMDADELLTRQNKAWFDKQLEDYTSAMERLAQYQVELGREEVAEEQEFEEETRTVVIVSAIEAADATVDVVDEDGTVTSIENPLITKDKEERAAAQAIVDATPQEVIDAFNES